ncbi:MAG: amidophosphoribosyltransferase, partial [Armatimonadota bacterium]|nr:amidophosphoribosyltransferase [Armatimonadota bacterium]
MTDPWREGPREECGVFGVIWPGQVVAPLVYLGLLALQHRGQESAGIATWSEAGLHLHKGMGLVSRVFDDRLSALLGSVGI